MTPIRSVEVRPGDRIVGFDGRTVELVADVVHSAGYVTIYTVARSPFDIGVSRTLWASDMVDLINR